MRILVLTAVALAACRVEQGSGDEHVDALADAWCDLQTRCAEACGTVALDRDLCILQASTQFSPSPIVAATFDFEFSQMCFDMVTGAMHELACDEPEHAWAWAERTCAVWHGTAERGETCDPFAMPEQYVFVSACRPGLTCAEDPANGSGAYRCRDVTEAPGEGEGCLRYQGGSLVEDRCADGLRCDDGVCTAGPQSGEPCDCGGLFGCELCVDGYCDADVGDAAGTCQPYVDVGDPCGASAQPECAYICDPATLVCIAPDDPGPLACVLSLQL